MYVVYRVISRAPGLKLVVQTLLSSLRPIGNIVLICCTFFIIFGILGVQVHISLTCKFLWLIYVPYYMYMVVVNLRIVTYVLIGKDR